MLPDTAAGLVFDYNGGGFTAVVILMLLPHLLIIPPSSFLGRQQVDPTRHDCE